MAAKSPGQRIAAEKATVLNISPLDDADNLKSLNSLYDLFASSNGPEGRLKVIHNNCGGEVTLTSSSDRMIQSLSISKPVIKLITSAIKDHNHSYCDGGLLLANLSLTLILNALKMNVHRRLVSEILDLALRECVNILESKQFTCKLASDQMSDKLVRSMFTSKPGCLIFSADMEHMCRLVLETFAHSDTTDPNTVLYAVIDGKPVEESRLLPGVIYPTPEIPTYSSTPLRIKHHNHVIITALIQTSMAGDSESFLDVTYELTSDLDLSSTVLTQLIKFSELLVEEGVGVVLSQKVVHPTIKRLLKEAGVFVLDRLGVALFTALHKLAGGNILDPFSLPDQWQLSSELGSLQHCVINRKSYIHIEGLVGTPVYTVLLCHRTKQALQEMKSVFERSLFVLRSSKKCGFVLCGAGCWQTSLALHLTNKVSSLGEDWHRILGCTKLQVNKVLQMFISALNPHGLDPSNHVVDLQTGHHFILGPTMNISCQCRAVHYQTNNGLKYRFLLGSDENNFENNCTGNDERKRELPVDVQVVDAYLPVLSALKTSVAISSMVLSIHNYIQDVN